MVKIYKKAKGFIPIESINTNIKYYTPKKNKFKVLILVLAFIPFFITIGTNWLYFFGIKILFKYSPLWIYK